MDEKEALENKISRRRMLKRIGAGAAIAWTAPVLTSLRTPAFGQRYPVPCEGCQPCPDRQACGGNEACQCWTRASDGACVCVDFVPSCTPENACGADLSCPSGFVCVTTCCGNLCANETCGAGELGAAAAGSGPSTVR